MTPPIAQRGYRLPIDFFFRSLAEDQQHLAICIIFSGTGSDGTLGARAIKGEGGLVIAQRPDTTEYDGMPQSIISNGLADYVLAPGEMPAALISYTSHTLVFKPDIESSSAKQQNYLDKIFNLVRTRTGHDFTQYKPKTIMRRLERRMSINQIEKIEDYLAYLQTNILEVNLLFHDFLIGVTSFFRDPSSFEALQEKGLPVIFADKSDGSVIRVWVPGCSTGEEAYSLAMILQEYIEKLDKDYTIQIFATDLDAVAIAHARAGIYSMNIAADITSERMSRYFVLSADKHTFQIRKTIRELIVFSEHDIIKDPPFSRMDIISCRNLLIYLDTDLQKKIIPMMHNSLNEKGILFLGSSESIGEHHDLFNSIIKNHKIYQRLGLPTNRNYSERNLANPELFGFSPILKPIGGEIKKISFKEIADSALLKKYAPAAVIINSKGEALYFHGRTGKYLEPAPGNAEIMLVKMAREGLHTNLVNAIHKATVTKTSVIYPNVRVKTNGDHTTINLSVEPIALLANQKANFDSDLYIVIFEVAPFPDFEEKKPIRGKKSITQNDELLKRITALELDNRTKEEYIQTYNEEMEGSNEELKSINEELQSVNEEMQSTNEELETSREELQSVNEELATVNAELQSKIQNLSKTENDLSNLLSSTGIGTIFVDLQQIIQRYTPSACKIIKLIDRDIGRPLSDIITNLINYDNLSNDIRSVLDTLIPFEKEVQANNKDWYLLRIIPYRTLENLIMGAVITFTDFTTIRRATEIILHEHETLKRLTAVVLDASDAITVLDLSGKILAWNPAAVKMYGYTETEALGMKIYDIIPESKKSSAKIAFTTILHTKVKPFPAQRICKDGSIIQVLVTGTALINADGAVYAISTTEKEESNLINL